MANKKTGRAKPLIAKAGVTKNRSRRYSSGGSMKNIYKCGGKLKTK